MRKAYKVIKCEYAFFFISLLLFGLNSAAQTTGTLKGSVTDSLSRERVVGATVYDANDLSTGQVTDVRGNYELQLKPGAHKIVCAVVGMKSDTFNVQINASEVTVHNFTQYLEGKELQTLVVSAGRYEQKLQDITVSMDLIKPNLIENTNSTNLTQTLNLAPGLNILDGEPQIRGGSGFDFGVGSRVALLIDGLPILPGDGGRIPWDLYPVENVEQIEIIKGASSVTYGSSALSGSINIRTAYPTDVPSTSVAVWSGLYDSPPIAGSKWWNGNANFSGTSFLHTEKIGRLDIVVGAMVLYDHGYIGPPTNEPIAGNQPITPISDNQMGQKTGRFNFGLRYHPKKIPGLNFGLNGNFGQSTNVLSLIWENIDSGQYRSYPNTVILQDQKMFYLDPFITYLDGKGFEHSLRARYYYTDNIETYNPTNVTNVLYAEYQCIKKFYELGGLNVTAGLVLNETFSHTDSLDYLSVYTPPSSNSLRNYAAYAQLDKKFFKVLNLSVGFRDENFIINNGTNTSKPIFRSGANVQLSKGTFWRCSYGQGYRYPTLAEKYLNSQLSSLSIFANPDLLPESSWNAEVGIKQGFKIGNFTGFLDAAGFWQQYQNTIEITYGAWQKVQIPYLPPGNYQDITGFKYLNTGPTRVKGVDISIMGEGAISKDFKMDVIGGWTYTLPQAMEPNLVYATDSAKGKLSYAKTSSNIANNVLKYRFQNIAKIDVELKYKKFSIGGNWTYYSNMQNIDTVFYQLATLTTYDIAQYREEHHTGINVFNARVGLQTTKKMKLAFVVNNLFNLSYSLRPLKIESPRTFALRLSYKVG